MSHWCVADPKQEQQEGDQFAKHGWFVSLGEAMIFVSLLNVSVAPLNGQLDG